MTQEKPKYEEQIPDFSKFFYYKQTIGKGAFSNVIGALDLKDGRECAVKVTNIIHFNHYTRSLICKR